MNYLLKRYTPLIACLHLKFQKAQATENIPFKILHPSPLIPLLISDFILWTEHELQCGRDEDRKQGSIKDNTGEE